MKCNTNLFSTHNKHSEFTTGKVGKDLSSSSWAKSHPSNVLDLSDPFTIIFKYISIYNLLDNFKALDKTNKQTTDKTKQKQIKNSDSLPGFLTKLHS